MSLENAIQNLVEAVQANTEALLANTEAQGGEVVEAAPAKAPAKAAAPAKAPAKAAAPVKGKAKPAPVVEEEEEEEDGGFGGGEETAEYTLDDVKVALQRYAATQGKPAAMEMLKKYGVSNIAKLDEGDYGALVEEVEAELAE